MFTYLFYLSVIWLVLGFTLVLLLGKRVRRSSIPISLLYHAVVIEVGAIIALVLFRVPVEIFIASALALALSVPITLLLEDWNAPGQNVFLFALITTAVYLGYAFAVTAFSPMSPIAFAFSFLLLLLETAALTLSLTFAFEVLDVVTRVHWRQRTAPKTMGSFAPRVSLHVPAYNEPPELVEKTLRALADLDYANYEVILVDNNTPSEVTWQPLTRVCQEFGFKCLHLEQWPGYKSGALNFALAMTDPQTEIIGVIDADYIVQPDYLRRIVPYFEDPEIAFVQTPQNYRDYEAGRFSRAEYDGYKYFFALSMPARNERNAIIFCGTMGLLRKKVLQEIGGWDEWCITEDAEASLRILNRGYKSLYVEEAFGCGLMPLDFEGLKKQRFRWAFGGVQILKKHWTKLMPWAGWIDPKNHLTGAQRYFYLVSGLQWFNELLTFAFTIMVLISAFLTIIGQTALLRSTTEAFVILPIVLVGTNMLRTLWGLKHAVSLSWGRALSALTLWFSLTWVVALACVQAIVQKRGVFLRTPKGKAQAAWVRALEVTSWETTLGILCVAGGVGAITRTPSPLTIGLFLLCLSQAIIYLSASLQSVLSLETTTGRRAIQPDRSEIAGSFAKESRLALQVGLAAVLILIVALAASLWPAPAKPPVYSILEPQPLLVRPLLFLVRPLLGISDAPALSPSPSPVLPSTPRSVPTPSHVPGATPVATPIPAPAVSSPAPGGPSPQSVEATPTP
jgi:cellulose synthase/poly-beta-1,6-N-acetylglucosamine synthase-like glycosyltransferase